MHNIKKGMLLFAVVSFFVFIPFGDVYGAGAYASGATSAQEPEVPLTILFTNDSHSCADYARLGALIRQERKKAIDNGSAVIVVDAGDIAMGSVFQTIYSDYAFEYVAMGLMGYDAVTCGNHDFDFGLKAFKDMLSAARRSPYIAGQSDRVHLPELVECNLNTLYPPYFSELGINGKVVSHKTVATENGEKSVAIGIYGIMGEHAYSCIARSDSLIFSDRITSAKQAVAALEADGADYIIALSHGGTLWAKGQKIDSEEHIGIQRYNKLKSLTEDGKLATCVGKTDVIISGHDHELLERPLLIGDCVIGATGSNGNFLGKIVLKGDTLQEYSMIPVTNEIFPDAEILKYVDDCRSKVSDKFLSKFNIHLGDTLAVINRELPLAIDGQGNMDLGFYIADSYRIAASQYVDAPIAIVPYGVIRKEIGVGEITNGDAFEVLSLGLDSYGNPGYPLVLLWVTGKELYDICELNASVAWGMEDARLFFSGMEFEYNRYRIPFTRVTDIRVNGNPVEAKKLYPIVTGLYTAQLMGMLESSSYGLLSVTPKDEYGTVLEDISTTVITVKNDNNIHPATIAEWRAFAEYIKKTELKNPPVKCSTENSTPFVWLKYILIIVSVIAISVWLLRFGKRARGRQL